MKRYPEVLDIREHEEWLDRVMPHGVDIQEQYEYYNPTPASVWEGDITMEERGRMSCSQRSRTRKEV